MTRLTTPLTATKVKNAKPKAKKYKLSDGRGLFLLIMPTGSKLWRLKYRFNNKEKECKKENTFYKVSQEWLESYKSQVSESYHTQLGRALINYIYPFIKDIPIKDVTRLEVIAILNDLKNQDLLETAKRTVMLLNKIYKYAVTFEYTPHNIIADIEMKTVLGERKKKNTTLLLPKKRTLKGF